ncbi:C-type lectin-like [Trinorchestia longiramus]|nr:C-type lectin-like [Trinorchestia longiramus]
MAQVTKIKSSLLLGLLLTFLGSRCRGLKVFDLQSDIRQQPNTDVYIQYTLPPVQQPDGTLKLALTTYTTCYRIQNKVITPYESHISYASVDGSNELLLGRQGENVTLIVKGVYYSLSVTVLPELHVWSHWCITFDEQDMTLYYNGQKIAQLTRHSPLVDLLLNGTLVLGQEQDDIGGGFIKFELLRGYTADINFWSYVLSDFQITAMANCSLSFDGDIFSTNVDQATIIKANITEHPLEYFCRLEHHAIAVPNVAYFNESAKLCEYLGSSIFGPENEEQNKELQVYAQKFSQLCSGSFWVGITDLDEEGVFRLHSTKKIVPTLFDAPPTDGDDRDCVSIIASSGKWHNEPCSTAAPRCTSCFITHHGALSLRGLCYEFQWQSLFDLQGYIHGSPYFHGFFGYVIYRSENELWVLVDTVNNVTIAVTIDTYGGRYPVGRTLWEMKTHQCNHAKREKVILGLSSCNIDQFMCSSGECIPGPQRCDAVANCEDQTDEFNCNILELPKGYLKHISPVNPFDKLLPLPLNITITINRFINVLDYKHTVEPEIGVAIKWHDFRIVYYNLRNKSKDNVLRDDEVNILWTPAYLFTNAQDGAIRTIGRKVKVIRTSAPLGRDHNSVDMNTRFSGTSAVLVEHKQYTGSFTCRFDVFFYPLDEQTCTIQVKLDIGEPFETLVVYNGEKYLQQFRVWNFSIYSDYTDATSRVTVHFHLTRLSNLIMISTMLPTLMLLIIGYSTLYIKPALLQVRLTVSLTTLLVLYTLFSQTSSTLPKTSYVKMIDVWFFFVIFVLFLIIVLHVIIERVGKASKITHVKPVKRMNSSQLQDNLSFDAVKGNPELEATPEMVLRVARLYVIPSIVVPTILIFWLMMAFKWRV